MKIYRQGIIFLVLAFAILVSGCRVVKREKPVVLCTTTMMAAVVEAIAGDTVEIETLIPHGMCPGHFDLAPNQAKRIADAQCVLIHGWEPFKEKIKEFRHGTNGLHVVNVPGNWMVPNVHQKAARETDLMLKKCFPRYSALFDERAEKYIRNVESAAKETKKRFSDAGSGQTVVVASDMQSPFLKWAGFSVAAEYGRPDEMSANNMMNLIDIAKRRKAGLVVDNLQSGKDTGLPIARETGAVHVVLSNFPAERGGSYSYVATLKENADVLLAALEKSNAR
jgi:ABC-type Zn uptake system ZnuABC Zn-binding protein ZnuA